MSNTGNLIVWFQNSDSYFEFKNNKFIKVAKHNINQKSNVALDNVLLSKHPNLIITNTLQDTKGNIWYATEFFPFNNFSISDLIIEKTSLSE